MEFINPNRFEKLLKQEGLKNPEDIWDNPTFKEIEEQIAREQNKIIEEKIERELLNKEKKKILSKLENFCSKAGEEFKNDFLNLLSYYSTERREIPEKILSYLKEKGLTLPQFIIANGKFAQQLLEDFKLLPSPENFDLNKEKATPEETEDDEEFYEYDYETEIPEIFPDDLILTFQLPKVLAEFWWKGGAYFNIEDKIGKIKSTAIEWGWFYRNLIPLIWKLVGEYENEKGLIFERINGVGEHDPKKYYYVWKISQWAE